MNKKQVIRLTESDLHRIVKESVNKILKEGRDFTHDEIKNLVAILKRNPIEEMWKPYDLGWCKVQRVEANQTSGKSYLMSDPHNMTAPQDMYSDGNNGEIYLNIGRTHNTYWFDESGHTYMCWK